MFGITLLLLSIGCISANRFSIMAPNVFHVGVIEQVSITIFDADSPVNVMLYLKKHKRGTPFYRVQGRVKQGSSIFLPVKVELKDISSEVGLGKQYVYLVAKSDDGHFQFEKEAKILLSYKYGMVFIQTDKPIYTPRQSVKIRVIPLEFDMKPSRKKITVEVLNPQGIKVKRWKDLDTSTGIISRRLDFDGFPLMGNWTIVAVSGHQIAGYSDVHNTSVQFEMKEYVLPKFSVKLKVPPYILKTDDSVTINIITRYTYGKPVVGTAIVKLSIESLNGTNFPFAKHNIAVDSSVTALHQRLQIIKEIPGNLWFPEKGRLLVEADVIERATGNKESAVDKSCQFTSSPYLIQFKNTPKYFKPGLRYVVKVVVNYPNNQPASHVRMLMSANQTKLVNGKLKVLVLKSSIEDPNKRHLTDEQGEAEFVVDACLQCKTITIQVKTANDKLNASQNAVANFLVKPFNAENGPLIMVRQLTPGKVGAMIQCESYRDHKRIDTKLAYAVVSRGRILSHNTTEPYGGVFKSWNLPVTPQMSPSARLIGYYIDDSKKVVADSILLKVEDTLPTKVDFPDAYTEVDGKPVQLNQVDTHPGSNYNIKIKAPPGTRLGLLCVDQSVYLLRNENRLTKDRIFKAAEELDLGCGVGGGKDSKDIFKNAGVVLMTNDFVSNGREDHGCNEHNSRKKRSVEDNIEDLVCCEMAKDNGNVTCGKLSIDSNKGLSKRCRLAFWNCCKALYGSEDTAVLGRSGMDMGEFSESDEAMFETMQVRSYFPETWIYEENVVGPTGRFDMNVTIPDTITTWVMQAVAINSETGLGLATPLNIVGYQDYFISLKMPYSVKRGEQVSLLATVFNYGEDEMQAKIYLKGDKDFCSIAANNKRAVIGIIKVPPKDAKSVAVPIVPKRIGIIYIEVFSILQMKEGESYMNSVGDAVRRELLVMPEGKEHRKSQSFVLDPSGSLNDGPKREDNKPDKPTQAPFESQTQLGPNGQFDSIKLKVPMQAIPGSVKAMVYVTGNLLGPVVNATIEDGMDRHFQQPHGCGEQTMIYTAPNVYALEYLIQTNQLTLANEEKAYNFIEDGYNRAQRFRLEDKAFSKWAITGSGSTWLTAFVMRVFCKANEFPGVDIDERLICESVNWLIRHQKSSGALPEVYDVLIRSMVGGAYSEGEAAMTAFVLSTLAECKCKTVNSEAIIRRATDYLERQYKILNKPYSMALTAYALSLVNSEVKILANNRLVQIALYDNARKSRYWNAGGNALNVETAGYALLTQIMLGRIDYAGPIVTYLINQRRGGIGFVFTQDTVVALQALAFYSENMPDRPLDLRVKLTSEQDAKWKPAEILFTDENALLRRQEDVTRFLGGKLYVDTRGNGVGQVEVEVRYNLPTSRGEICKFDVNATVSEIKDNSGELFGPVQSDAVGDAGDDKKQAKKKKVNKKKKGGKKRKSQCRGKNKKSKKCRGKGKNQKNKKMPNHQPVKSIHLKVCTRYREEGNTSMAIMDIGILTGFKPDQKSLEKLNTTLEDELGMIEVSDRSLVLYFNEIPSHRALCVDVQFDRVYFVGEVQAVPVNVYDYYEPDESCSVFYGPQKSSTLKLGVCDVGFRSCKCSQENCAQQDPLIGNIDKLIKKTCKTYHYAIKGKVLLIDEHNTMLAYVVDVVDIIQQGNKLLNVSQKIELWKSAACHSPQLDENKEYLFMGLDDGDRYNLDKTSFVKLWPESPKDNKDKQSLEKFAGKHRC